MYSLHSQSSRAFMTRHVVFAVLLISFFALFFLPASVAAQGQGIQNPISCDTISACLTNVVKWVLGLVGLAAVAYIVYGGFLYITAGGNDDQIRQGKRAMLGAIVGVIFVGLAYAIVEFVFQALNGGEGGGGGGPTQFGQ